MGFRPFVYRLARDEGLVGWVRNDSSGVLIEVEGPEPRLARFLDRLPREAPAVADVAEVRHESIPPDGDTAFVIARSERLADALAEIPADLGICDDCRRELLDPADRRYLYPFINCTNCGPRFTIAERLPYDRPFTSMKAFTMCSACQAEYDDPANRRFHAQPNACWECGPRLWVAAARAVAAECQMPDAKCQIGERTIATDGPIGLIASALREGKIAAIKGLGGFHLACDATNEEAVQTLRDRKWREKKPFAVMVPDLAAARRLCWLSDPEERLLGDYRKPIVLARKRSGHGLANAVAPASQSFGVMLPYTPAHVLLMHALGAYGGDFGLRISDCGFQSEISNQQSEIALVMTSANRTDEPIAIDNDEAVERLGEVADLFLLHNRAIIRRSDDSVTRVFQGEPTVQRRARGFVPTAVALRLASGETPGSPPAMGTVGSRQEAVGSEEKTKAAGGRQDTVGSQQKSVGRQQTTDGGRQSTVGSRQEAVGSEEEQSAVGRKQSAGGNAGDRELQVSLGLSVPTAGCRVPTAVLALGGDLKNTICIIRKGRAYLSQHIGDLDHADALSFFEETIEHFEGILETRPAVIAHDLHPGYHSTAYARRRATVGLPDRAGEDTAGQASRGTGADTAGQASRGTGTDTAGQASRGTEESPGPGRSHVPRSACPTVPGEDTAGQASRGTEEGVRLIGVQHHHAHAVSCMAEHGLEGPVIGVSLDGTGYGTDGRIWGGEFLVATLTDFERVAHLRYVPMPGGERAIQEPWRMALAYLGERVPELERLGVDYERLVAVEEILKRRVACPETSSMGRLFDGVSALLGICSAVSYEGQAAIELEALAEPSDPLAYPFQLDASSTPWTIDPGEIVRGVLDDLRAGSPRERIADRFHNTIVEVIRAVCHRIRHERGLATVVLSGGCFQNMLLLERTTLGLKDDGFDVRYHRLVPTNDGGLALGQAVIALARASEMTNVE